MGAACGPAGESWSQPHVRQTNLSYGRSLPTRGQTGPPPLLQQRRRTQPANRASSSSKSIKTKTHSVKIRCCILGCARGQSSGRSTWKRYLTAVIHLPCHCPSTPSDQNRTLRRAVRARTHPNRCTAHLHVANTAGRATMAVGVATVPTPLLGPHVDETPREHRSGHADTRIGLHYSRCQSCSSQSLP